MTERSGPIARLALTFTAWTERWVPDAFIFALLATVVVFTAGVATSSTVFQVVDAWGKGFWELIPFTMQMSLVIITGYVLASSPPVGRLIGALAGWPQTPRSAVAFVTFFSLASSWFNWGFSLIFSAMLAIEVARRVPSVDYRAVAAASFLGQGSIWAQGLSSSAALLMATPGTLQPAVRDIVAHGGIVPGGIISFSHTIFLWQSFVAVAVETVIVVTLMYYAAPVAGQGKTARDLGIDLGGPKTENKGQRTEDSASSVSPSVGSAKEGGTAKREGRSSNRGTDTAPTPGAWLEHLPVLSWFVVLLGGAYIFRYFAAAAQPLNAINLNNLIFIFLLLGFLLHRTPARLMRAVQEATPAVWGVILQFPFYAGIAAIITGTSLNAQLAGVFVRLSNQVTFPPLVAIYSAVLGLFVPSAGSKWVIEVPYVMAAAHELKVHVGWIVAAYDLGEALANLIQPFWMLPILGLFKLRARDIMGYTFVVFLVLVPVVVILITLLGMTLNYPL